jgi:hypothetical protein
MFANNSKANDNRTDSTKIIHFVNEFYNWYILAIKEMNHTPQFVETENGMTSLDLSKYIDNLKTYRFSDSLIIKEKESYLKCIENLKTVRFSDFNKTEFWGLGDYEDACCDFGNCYRWIGSQESISGIRIQGLQFISTDTVLVSIEYSWIGFDEDLNSEYTYYGHIDLHGAGNKLIVIKQNNDWYIDKFYSFCCEPCRERVKTEE